MGNVQYLGEILRKGLDLEPGEGVEEVHSCRGVVFDLDQPEIAIGRVRIWRRAEEEDGAFGEVEAPGGVGDSVVREEGEAARGTAGPGGDRGSP